MPVLQDPVSSSTPSTVVPAPTPPLPPAAPISAAERPELGEPLVFEDQGAKRAYQGAVLGADQTPMSGEAMSAMILNALKDADGNEAAEGRDILRAMSQLSSQIKLSPEAVAVFETFREAHNMAVARGTPALSAAEIDALRHKVETLLSPPPPAAKSPETPATAGSTPAAATAPSAEPASSPAPTTDVAAERAARIERMAGQLGAGVISPSRAVGEATAGVPAEEVKSVREELARAVITAELVRREKNLSSYDNAGLVQQASAIVGDRADGVRVVQEAASHRIMELVESDTDGRNLKRAERVASAGAIKIDPAVLGREREEVKAGVRALLDPARTPMPVEDRLRELRDNLSRPELRNDDALQQEIAQALPVVLAEMRERISAAWADPALGTFEARSAAVGELINKAVPPLAGGSFDTRPLAHQVRANLLEHAVSSGVQAQVAGAETSFEERMDVLEDLVDTHSDGTYSDVVVPALVKAAEEVAERALQGGTPTSLDQAAQDLEQLRDEWTGAWGALSSSGADQIREAVRNGNARIAEGKIELAVTSGGSFEEMQTRVARIQDQFDVTPSTRDTILSRVIDTLEQPLPVREGDNPAEVAKLNEDRLALARGLNRTFAPVRQEAPKVELRRRDE